MVEGEGGEEAFRRSRPLFRSLVRGKLISFIRGGDEGGGRRQRERRGGEGETSFCSQARGSAKFYFGRVPRKDYPYRENMEVKGASRKRGLSSSFESISNPPPPPPFLEIAISPPGIRASYSSYSSLPHLARNRRIDLFDLSMRIYPPRWGTPLSDPMVDK